MGSVGSSVSLGTRSRPQYPANFPKTTTLWKLTMFERFRGSGLPCGRLLIKRRELWPFLFGSSSVCVEQSVPHPYSNLDGGATPSQEPRRQHKDRTNEREECFERDADQPERQRQKPDYGKEDSASRAKGQKSTKRMHQPTKRISAFTSVSFHHAARRQRYVVDRNHSGFANLAIPVATTALQVGWRL